MQRENGFGFQQKNTREENMSNGCCIYCNHCDDEIIAEMMECKCHCHTRGGNTS